jgi:hypothetical protein
MRKLRRLINFIFTTLGTALVLYALIYIEPRNERLLVAGLGLVLIEAGVWRFTRSLMPNERKYTALRTEADYFTNLVRRLNRAAIQARGEKPGDSAESAQDDLTHVHEEMHHSVDRMLRLAGKADDDVEPG